MKVQAERRGIKGFCSTGCYQNRNCKCCVCPIPPHSRHLDGNFYYVKNTFRHCLWRNNFFILPGGIDIQFWPRMLMCLGCFDGTLLTNNFVLLRKRGKYLFWSEIRSECCDGAQGNVYEILIGIMEGSYFPCKSRSAHGCWDDGHNWDKISSQMMKWKLMLSILYLTRVFFPSLHWNLYNEPSSLASFISFVG